MYISLQERFLDLYKILSSALQAASPKFLLEVAHGYNQLSQ